MVCTYVHRFSKTILLWNQLHLISIACRCPTTADLGLLFYNVERRMWGFRFNMPKFEDRSELFVSCDVYVCDDATETKPYCDRSCGSGAAKADKQRRSPDTTTTVAAAAIPAHVYNDTGSVQGGPFVVSDGGGSAGRIITSGGNIRPLRTLEGESSSQNE